MKSFEQIRARYQIGERHLTAWIEQDWVRPLSEGGAWMFSEADEARVRLICELRGDLAVNDEAVPLVLRLLDQVYGLRQVVAELRDAIDTLPPDSRERLRGILASTPPETSHRD